MNELSKISFSRRFGIACCIVVFLVLLTVILPEHFYNETSDVATYAELQFLVGDKRKNMIMNVYVNDPPIRVSRNISKKDEVKPCMGITRRRYPTAIIAGVTKGGTTALTKFLNVHPRIAARYAHLEEDMHTAFFHRGDFVSDIFHYRDLMPCSYADQITIERSPGYFDNHATAGRIRRFNPNMKILILVRDPIARAHSHYLMWRANNVTRNKTFEEHVIKDNKTNSNSHLVYVSSYSQHIKFWLENFGLNQIMFLDSQHFVLNPAAELNRVEDFLGIERFFTPDMFKRSKERGIFCPLTIERNLDCIHKGKGRVHPQIQEAVKTKLKDYFRPLNEIFFKMIKRRFEWGY